MYIANKWGQGQIFAFSALDGKTSAENDFAGTLCGDRLGITFYTKIRRELAIIPSQIWDLSFDMVTGDCICAVINKEKYLHMIYHDTNLIIGDVCCDAAVNVFVEGNVTTKNIGNVTLQDTADGDFTALALADGKFAFAYGRSAGEAVEKASRGLKVDVEAAYNAKLDYYKKHQLNHDKYGRLYSKCISVMKTQLYSPEGNFGQIWSTPDRLPHKYLWLWDSVFHAIGHRNIDTDIAQQLILSVFDNQYENGMVPHLATTRERSDITQPPILAWGAWKVYEKSGDKDFLSKVFWHNSKFLQWCDTYRRIGAEPLYTWKTGDDVNCRCDESGMDNSPRFDGAKLLLAIDFSCFMANEMRHMKKIAVEIGEDGQRYEKEFAQISEAINRKLWDAAEGFYYDYSVSDQCLSKVETVASFLPLYAGVCNEDQAKSLVRWLEDPDTFGKEFPIPCISAKHETYGTDMWRGPVWLNYNYLIISGLEDYGYREVADRIRQKTLENVNKCYERTGALFEFYDPDNRCEPWSLNRKGPVVEPYDIRIRYQSIRDYGWSCTVVVDMLQTMLHGSGCRK